MGCDIHGVVERRVDNKWITVKILGALHRGKPHAYEFASDAGRSRNYRRFAALAGVRGSGPAPKGIPDDASETAKYLIERIGVDGHSHSWLSIREAIEIFDKTENWPEDAKPDVWPRAYPSDLFFGVDSTEIEDHRLVFWFDN